MDFTRNDLNKTALVRPQWLEKNRKWYEVDATGKTLWKLAVDIANKLSGKDVPYKCDFWDWWHFVVVQNAEKINVTGRKLEQKLYYNYSWYKWNLKSMTLSELLKKNPQRAIWQAVRWMLPKNKLRDKRMKRLKIFVGKSDKYNYLNPEKI